MATLKVVLDTAVAFQVRQAALRQGRTTSEHLRRLVERSLSTETPTLPDAQLDKCERTGGTVQTAAYLSGALASAVRKHAAELDRSHAWTLRDLVRCELRRRGLLPKTPSDNNPVDAALEVAV
jgi:hypothetical protein